ncbi:MAG: hypothetical protein KJ622_07040 [Alphaproteobacteria bacterium]|nr:hypothetical protein [Alphaproteobacteria bacterium]
MSRLRTIIGYTCCAILVWMSVVSGLFAVPSLPLQAASAGSQLTSPVPAAGQVHNEHSAAQADRHHDQHLVPQFHHQDAGAGSRTNPASQCISTCLELFAAKIVPDASAAIEVPLRLIVPVRYDAGEVVIPGRDGSSGRANWSTGPPGPRAASGSNAQRLMALNARLRI